MNLFDNLMRSIVRTLGENVTYTPGEGEPYTLFCVFQDSFQGVDEFGSPVSSTTPVATVWDKDMVSLPVVGDHLEARGITYRVVEIQRDGVDVSRTLILQKL